MTTRIALTPMVRGEEEGAKEAELLAEDTEQKPQNSELHKLCCDARLGGNWESVRDWLDTNQAGDEDEKQKDVSAFAKYKDPLSRTALHLACLYEAPVDVVTSILAIAPETAAWADGLGDTPLHTVFHHLHRPTAPQITRAIFEQCPESAQVADASGKLAISYLVEEAGRVTSAAKGSRFNIMDCSDQYICMIHSMGDGSYEDSAALFGMLDAFPPWLKSHAVLHEQVKKRMSSALAKRFPFMTIFNDIVFQTFLLVVMLILSNLIIENNSHTEPGRVLSSLLVMTGGYQAMRYLIRIIITLDTMWRSPVRWIEAYQIVSCFIIGSVGITGSPFISYDTFRAYSVVSMGLNWIACGILIASLWEDFAIFVLGVFYATQRITAFVFALMLVVIAYAQMLYLLHKQTDDCVGLVEPDFPFCEFETSLLRVYTMVIGEVEETDFRGPIATFLYCTFLFYVVVLLANVLAFIIGSSVVDTRKGRSYFWMNRLRFIMEMDTVTGNIARVGVFNVTCKTTLREDYGRKYWDSLMSVFEPDETNWWAMSLRLPHAVVTIPIWILLGVVTGGVLFPPQIREWVAFSVLASKTDDIQYESPYADILANMKEENASLKKEMKAVKKETKNIEKKVDIMLKLLQEKLTK